MSCDLCRWTGEKKKKNCFAGRGGGERGGGGTRLRTRAPNNDGNYGRNVPYDCAPPPRPDYDAIRPACVCGLYPPAVRRRRSRCARPLANWPGKWIARGISQTGTAKTCRRRRRRCIRRATSKTTTAPIPKPRPVPETEKKKNITAQIESDEQYNIIVLFLFFFIVLFSQSVRFSRLNILQNNLYHNNVPLF